MSDSMTAAEFLATQTTERGNKYGAKRTEVDGITFDSKREAERYTELRNLERAGIIRDLELQPSFALIVNGHHCGFYRADFRYYDKEQEMTITEDAKSPATRTPLYRLKAKLVRALYGVDIQEV